MTNIANLYEQRVLANIRLTKHQKQVLAMIIASAEGNVPDEEISKGPNLTSARKMLTKLGLIVDTGENRFSVSDKGAQVAKDEHIIDDSGQLTEHGTKLAYGKDIAPPSGPGPSGPTDEPADAAFAGTSTDVGLPGPSESFKLDSEQSLLQELAKQI